MKKTKGNVKKSQGSTGTEIETAAIAKLVKFKKEGKKWNVGNKFEQEISQLIGVESVLSPEIALNILKERVEKKNFDYVEEKISQLSQGINENLGGDKESEEKIKTEIGKIVNQDEFRTQAEEVAGLAQVLPKNNKIGVEVTAKEIKISLDKWQENNIEEVRGYRKLLFEKKFEKEVREANLEINEDQTKAVKTKANLISEFYFGDGGIENQKNVVVESNKNESVGKIRNSWIEVQAIVGLMRKKPEEVEEIVKKNEELDSRLTRIRIPYEKLPQARAYDDVVSSLSQPEIIESFKSIGGGVRGGIRTINNISKMTGGWVEKGVVGITNKFASKIGNQVASEFVKKSAEILVKEGIKGGLKAILSGVAKGGAKAMVAGGIGVAAGVATGPPGWLITAITLAKKFIGAIADKLGVNFAKKIKESLAITGNKIIDGVIQIGSAIVIIPTIAVGIAIGPIVVIIIVCLFIYQMLQSNLISSLVPKIEEIDNKITHGEITYTEDGRIKSCGVDMTTDFYRNSHVPIVSPEAISMSSKTVEDYNNELKNFIGDQYGKQCGVVYAAQYLAYEFDFWVPYWLTGSWPQEGINPSWGSYSVSDWQGHREGNLGLDCGHFRNWAWINGGFRASMDNVKPNIPFGNCDKIKSEIEPGDGLYMEKPAEADGKHTYSHSAIVIAYDDNTIKFAHSGGGSGVTTGLIDICTGIGVDNKNHFDYLQKKNYGKN